MLGTSSSYVPEGLQYLFPGMFHPICKWTDLKVGLGCNSLFELKCIRRDLYEPLAAGDGQLGLWLLPPAQTDFGIGCLSTAEALRQINAMLVCKKQVGSQKPLTLSYVVLSVGPNHTLMNTPQSCMMHVLNSRMGELVLCAQHEVKRFW